MSPELRSDTAFAILRNGYRRQLLQQLYELETHNPYEVDLTDLVGESDDFDTVALQLYHNHLPKLADAGYVEWDRDGLVVRRGPRFGAIEPLIECMDDGRDDGPIEWP